ncbi:hypothetical protein SARI_00881 [Salmonella enterica subsp. arizonae serovar 62:z4,z23:-]|uniref:Uncharacterized protein n=1 Tax=Salmonella arizonae (strain ATCC BAA-731 / CDC346-86 / RSK2980) TaxID=41514 RepID=A9MLT5_SALAR|nr:hypothetical protein SARI_00881 [Salmonella enterica subsp. arizonae serovar 62:z4,z23:-]
MTCALFVKLIRMLHWLCLKLLRWYRLMLFWRGNLMQVYTQNNHKAHKS